MSQQDILSVFKYTDFFPLLKWWFFKENNFLWENLGSPILSIPCFSGWGHFAYVVCELLDTISMVYLLFYCKSSDTFLSRWQTAAQWRRRHEGKLTLLERIAKGLSGNQEPRESHQSWSVCMCHWQALRGYKRPRFYVSFSSILMWKPNVQLERCSIEGNGNSIQHIFEAALWKHSYNHYEAKGSLLSCRYYLQSLNRSWEAEPNYMTGVCARCCCCLKYGGTQDAGTHLSKEDATEPVLLSLRQVLRI